MHLDSSRRLDDWLAGLRDEAEHAWGAARAEQLDPALRRMAEAIRAVASHTPHAETAPHRPGAAPKGGRDA